MRNTSTWLDSPPSPTTWSPNSFRVLPTLLAAVGATCVVIVAVALYVAYALFQGTIDPAHTERIAPVQTLVAQLIAYFPVALYFLIILPPLSGRSLKELGIRMPTARELLLAVGVAGLMWIVVTGSSAAVETLSHHRDTEAAIALLKGIKTPYEKFLFVSVAVVFAPLVEELAFRVFAFNAILRWTNVPVAAVGSGILFGLVHALGAAPSQLLTVSLPLALGGIVLAGIYAATRCYWASVLTHALFNSVTVVAYFIFGVKS